MSTATVVFLVIGGVGVLILAAGLLGLDLFDLDGPVPGEAIAAIVGAFGFAAAIVSSLVGAHTSLSLLAAAGAGAGAAVPAGWLATRLVRAVRRMPTDATPRREDLTGLVGMVITPIPDTGYGTVRVTLGGQPVTLYATADDAIPRGVHVLVITAPSDTSVVVERTPQLPDQHAVP